MKIGIIVAMAEELAPLLNCMGESMEYRDTGYYKIYRFNLKHRGVVVINCGIGEIAAAAATQLLISEYKVDCIINYGLAGALNCVFQRGDFVLVESVVHYDFDTTGFDDSREIGRYAELSSKFILTDKKMNKILLKQKELKSGVCASGDKFIADKRKKAELCAIPADICDMESAGILLTACRAGVPAVIIKVLSDNAEEGAVEQFDEMLNRSNEEFCQILKDFISIL